MRDRKTLFALIIFLFIGVILFFSGIKNKNTRQGVNITSNFNGIEDESKIVVDAHALSIDSLRKGIYPGSDIVIEETLDPGSNYQRYLVSYKSEGLKIYALLTVPNGTSPNGGWPVIVFNHGYIPPLEYRTTERYIAYTDAFSRNGYILLRPDYRGHGNSEGKPAGAYGSNAYTIDVLNAIASIKREGTDMALRQAQGLSSRVINKEKIGMWGHSMGGFITLRTMVASKDVKAGVIWAGVVVSYADLFSKWRRPSVPTITPSTRGGSWRLELVQKYGTPEKNPAFWNSISANSYLKDISGSLQMHHGTADTSVPLEFSEILVRQMKQAGKKVELYTYPGDDHNIAANLGLALQRSVEFFDQYLKTP